MIILDYGIHTKHPALADSGLFFKELGGFLNKYFTINTKMFSSYHIKIHTTKEVIVTRETISNIETKLPPNNFMRVHRSYIIAISKITAYSNEFISS